MLGSLFLLLVLSSCKALMVGRRRIQSSVPKIGGQPADALMDVRPTMPALFGFIGAQAVLPSLGQCSVEAQIQPPWFLGDTGAGGGICPPEYWNLQTLLPGGAVVAFALGLGFYFNSNRLLITEKGLGNFPVDSDRSEFKEEIMFSEISDWVMTPVGLIVKASKIAFFPLAWDQKSVEAIMEERVK